MERGKKAEFGEWRDKGDETEGRALDESRKSEFGEGRDEMRGRVEVGIREESIVWREEG